MLRLRNFRRAGFERAVAAGANVRVVQTVLGHKSATMALDLYGHQFADQLDEVADAMDSARAAAGSLRTKSAVIY